MRNKNTTKYVTILLLIIYLGSIAIFVKDKNTMNILIASICTVGTIILYFVHKKYTRLIDNNLYIVSALFVMISSLLGSCYGFYDINHYDDFLHLWSGLITVSIAFSIMTFFHSDNDLKKINKYFIIIYVFMFSMGVASLWEISEFLIDRFLGMNMQVGGLVDTMIDMIDALVGAIIMLPFIYKKLNLTNKKLTFK
ncbi:hypothetical protein [Romboutsia lituseburensis]|uniref:Membrane-spanning protein n=1 Tax=Romboutsia lituseburensis DSM 797 TaxID=1121325 RepID=A0A1G9JC79_9FIRM|nr:hypothetical protein [Romboutsia lituseburensis]CEH33553.1 ABC super ATP binding cassette transporter permease subunit [Romboutsia lituseburensis]SDL34816.1 hypothetical protein SAMN04515677_101587 [Romboutsia lituseburensis DSM 797]